MADRLDSRLSRRPCLSLAAASMAERKGPADFLKTIIGRPVVVKLNSGVDYRGVQDAWCREPFSREMG